MKAVQRETVALKATELLRRQIKSGALRNEIPGVRKLAAELGVSRDSARVAVKQLEAEGLLRAGGHGRAREVMKRAPRGVKIRRTLSVAIIAFEPPPDLISFEPTPKPDPMYQKAIFETFGRLESEGYAVQIISLGVAPTEREIRVKVEAIAADAWILNCPPSSAIEWFIQRGLPAFAMGGMTKGLPIAANTIFMANAVEQAVNHLHDFGHRRIVMITPSFLRKPSYSSLVLQFQEIMARKGVTVNDYHLPDWVETPGGLFALIESLYAVTPPTALLIYDSKHLFGILSYFSARGIRVTQDCSVVLMLSDALGRWWEPPLAHFEWKDTRYIQQISRWLKSVREGRPNLEQHHEETVFVPGNSIGRARVRNI